MKIFHSFVNKIFITQVVILLSALLFKPDDLRLKLYRKKRSYFDERWLFMGRFKVKSVPGMRNKLYHNLFINLHNELKSYPAKRISKFIKLCILKQGGG